MDEEQTSTVEKTVDLLNNLNLNNETTPSISARAITSSRSSSETYLWIEGRLDILGFPKKQWDLTRWPKQHIEQFLNGNGPKVLTVIRGDTGVYFTSSESGHNIKSVIGLSAYFLRPNFAEISISNIRKKVQYGSVGGRVGMSFTSLEILMKGVVEKQVSDNAELNSHYHRCMTTLTDTLNASEGVTILYTPNMELYKNNDTIQQKDKIQILESIIIHWTRQIKEAMNNHDNTSNTDNAGPIDEIELWKSRASNLISIQKQLESENSKEIIVLLEKCKSNYVTPLLTLAQQLGAKATEANENLTFLDTIREQALALRTIEPSKIVTILPDFMKRTRLIWSFSKYYNNSDTIAGLLRKVSNELIRRFREYISLSEILDGDVDQCIVRLNEAISSGREWKRVYNITYLAIEKQRERYGSTWEIEDGTVFAQLDAFMQRCRDLIDICEGQIQFARKSGSPGGQPGPLPFFGGTKANEIIEGLKGIQLSYERTLTRHIRELDYPILDVRVNRWHDDSSAFKGKVKDLEVLPYSYSFYLPYKTILTVLYHYVYSYMSIMCL